MKQEASKKSKLWIWLVAGIAVLLAAGAAVAGIILFGGNQPGNQGGETGPVGGRPAIYFNVDREKYLEADTGLSAREPGEDGNYYVRFAIDGELKELLVADKQLVNFIDTMDVMGLTLDADNTVIDAVDIREIATEVAKDFFVQSINGDVLTLDSSLALNGMEMNVSKGELGRVFSLTAKAEFPGQEIELSDIQPMDSVAVYGNDLGEVTHIVVTSSPIESPIYWRCNQFYDSTKKETTRVPDENGVYTIEFFVNGERVALKTKSKSEATAIDKPNNFTCHKGLVFDEDGYIIDRVTAASGIRGILACEMYETISVDGNTFTAERQISGSNEVGKQYTATIDENCKIWDVSFLEDEENRGKKLDTLRVGDRLCVFTDTNGNPVEIFVTHRLCGSPLYINPTKMASNGETTRKPDGNGWYYIDLVINNELKTFRSKDKALISKIDTQSSRGVGLELDGDIITRVWGSDFVYGYSANVGYYIDSITSIVLTITNSTGTKTVTKIMNAECEVTNVSGIGGEIGSKTTPQVGDYIIAISNPAGEARHIIVIQRAVDEPVYYNLLRKYNSTTKKTTREKVNGYYEFLMAKDGKQVTVKTDSEAIASKIDSYNPGYMSLKVRGGIVSEVYSAAASTGGQPQGNGYYVKGWQEDGTLLVYSKSSSATQTLKMAKDYKIYNVSPFYDSHKGEKISSVQKDDMIAGLRNRQGEVVILYVRSRAYDVKACWHVKRMPGTTEANTRKPDADGYYNFEIAQDGKIVKVKTKDKLVAGELDAKSAMFGMYVKNGIVKGTFGPLEVKNSAAAGDINGTKFVKLSGRKLTVLKGGKEMTVTLRSDCKIYDIASFDNFGKVTKLKEGDTIGRSYKDKDGNHSYLFITGRYYPRVKGQTGYCEHCGQTVDWEVWGGQAFPAQDGHYYVGSDMRELTQVTMGHKTIDTDIVLDLNGKTAAFGDNRAFLIYMGATLNIIDSVGGGKITARGQANNEGVVRLANTDNRPGKLNLYGGTLELGKHDSGAVTPLWRGGVVYLNGANTEFNMYGGTITGGQVADNLKDKDDPHAGGNIYNNNGKLSIYGGTIEKGYAASGRGHNIFSAGGQVLIAGGKLEGGITMNANATVTLSGAPEISKTHGGLILEAGAAVKLDQITAGTVIPVDAAGTFMTGLTNPEAVKGYFESTKEGFSIIASGDSLACGEAAYCEHCGQDVVWSEFEGTLGNGHYYLSADSRLSSNTVGKLLSDGKTYGAMTAVLDLRGFKLLPTSDDQTKAQNRLMIVRGEADITVFDSSEAQTGMIVGRPNVTDAGAVVRLTEKAKFTLLSGTIALELLEGQEYHIYRGGVVMLNSAGSVFNMLGGKITGGQVVSEPERTLMGGGNVYLRGGTFNMEGGVIEGGNSNGLPGMNMYVSDEFTSNVNLYGGTIDGGIYVAPGAKVTVGGEIKIANKDNGLDLTSGAKLNIEKIDTNAAEIYVKADGVFTNPSEFYAEAAEIIKPVDEALFINKVSADKTLHYGEKYIDLGSVTNDSLAFEDGTQKAYCEHCGEVVEWIALEAITEDFSLEADKHYYLTGNVENAAAYVANSGYEVGTGADGVEYWKTSVVHLNGFNVTSTARAFQVNSCTELFILGNGTVSGASAAEGTALNDGKAATLYVRGKLNLLGGTYTTAATATLPTLTMAVPAGRTTVYSNARFVQAEGATGDAIHVPAGRLELKGATVEGNIDMAQNIVDGTLDYQTHLVATDATVTGTLVIPNKSKDATNIFEIEGASKIGELNIAATGLIDFVDLADGADITVVATGVFTGANELNEEYVKAEYVKSGVTDMVIAITKTGELEIAEPEFPITNADLVFEEGTNKAFCEHCGEVVEWTALEAITESFIMVKDTHYYLPASVENTAVYKTNGSDGSSANPNQFILHMNGHDIVSSTLALYVPRNSELTVLGNGTITGANTEGNTDSLDGMHSATIHNRGRIHLNGVTVKAADATELPVITQANPQGITEINETATVIGNVEAPAAHLIVKGLLDGNVDFTNNYVGGTTNYQHYLTVDNGTITGTVKVPMRDTETMKFPFVLIGTVKIGQIEVEAGKLLTVDQLAPESEVGIKAELNTAFTVASDNAQALFEGGVFTSAEQNTMIGVQDNALMVVEDSTNKNLEFIDGTSTAFCQHCQQNVEWTALEAITANKTLVNGTHYYLPQSVENSAAYYTPAGSASAVKNVIVHLNGNNITSSQRAFFVHTFSNLYILGNGTVSGASTQVAAEDATDAVKLSTGYASTIYVRGNLHLLGGTYTHAATSTLPTVTIGRPNDAINIYKGVVFNQAEGVEGSAIEVPMGHLNIYGGEIWGNVLVGVNNVNAMENQYHFYMEDGMILGVCFVDLLGTSGNSWQFEVAGSAKIAGLAINTGKLLTLGELKDDAMIFVVADGPFTQANPKAAEYLNNQILPLPEIMQSIVVQDGVMVGTINPEFITEE